MNRGVAAAAVDGVGPATATQRTLGCVDPGLLAVTYARGGVFTRADALEAGYSSAEIMSRLRSGAWRTVRRGVYAAREVSVPDVHLRLAAALAVLTRKAVLSHRSAAVLHGLPLVGVSVPAVEVTIPGAAARRHPDLVVHGRALPPAQVTQLGGLRVTDMQRTALDLARQLNLPAAVVVVDAVLRAGVSPASLRELAADEVGPYSRKARRAVCLGDGRAESPGESLSRLAIASHGLPAPQLQSWVTHRGRTLGRVDFLWPQYRTIGEFDGRLKYDDPRTLWDEKRREDSMRSIGYEFVRWTWDDAYGDFRPVASRLRAAFARAAVRVPHTA